MAEPIDLPFGSWTWVGRRKHKFSRICQVVPMCPYGMAHWRHLVNTSELSVCGVDAALCQITLSCCFVFMSLQRSERNVWCVGGRQQSCRTSMVSQLRTVSVWCSRCVWQASLLMSPNTTLLATVAWVFTCVVMLMSACVMQSSSSLAHQSSVSLSARFILFPLLVDTFPPRFLAHLRIYYCTTKAW